MLRQVRLGRIIEGISWRKLSSHVRRPAVAMESNFSFLSLGAAVEMAASSPAELVVAFFTLSVLEIVLGIDNVIFIAILAG